MALPTDTPNPGGASAPAFASGRLTPEDAERLAATFRPSWEVDDTPFAGLGTPAGADFRALKSGATLADVRGAVHALNGTHAPAPATVLQDEPTSSVIVDGTIAADVAAASPPMTQRIPAATAQSVIVSQVQAPMPQQRTVVMAAQRTLVMPNAPRFSTAAARRSMPSLDLGGGRFGSRSKLGLWIGLGAAGLVLLGVGVWFASEPKQQAAPVPVAETAVGTAPMRTHPPPPPAETIETQAAQAAPALPTAPPPASGAPPAVLPAPQPTVVAAAPPTPVMPPPRAVVAPAPRPPVWAPPPAAKPVPKAKTGQTIVRDVPF